MENDYLKKFHLNSFREVNFEMRDVLYFLGESEVEDDRVFFDINIDFEKPQKDLFEIFLHIMFAYKYIKEGETGEDEEDYITLLHVDFVCDFKIDNKNRRKGVEIDFFKDILRFVINSARGYIFGKLPSQTEWIPIIPEMNLDDLLKTSKVVTKGKFVYPEK